MTDPYSPLAAALRAAVAHMDDAADPAWGALTGLQRTLLSLLAEPERQDRYSLAENSHTARSAVVPSVRSLITRGLVREVRGTEGMSLVLTTRAWLLVDDVRLHWRQALEDAAVAGEQALSPDDARLITGALERFLRSG
ncbi:hypothetical protein [Clavibacter sp. VKM Ac-2872]|uniref:hypothetical protein n=1 Tax=Clavibacter sp. VKM Ac-2872 TaxID=2783812 RepID=UPI00188DB2A8|nr:hypothetical protein [Clavibacter sp. VKM Ac-2872]MBF4625820.1 hypothetical protein [Clavibacter sp. VKM Ac-2872]